MSGEERLAEYVEAWDWHEQTDELMAGYGHHMVQLLYRFPKDGQTDDMKASIESMLADLQRCADTKADLRAQIHDLLEEREELLTEIRRLRMGRHPAGRALRVERAETEGPWIDKQGDVWTLGDDGLLHTPETRPLPREHVEKKWGPLRESVIAPEVWDRATVHADNVIALAEALTERDAEREGGAGA